MTATRYHVLIFPDRPGSYNRQYCDIVRYRPSVGKERFRIRANPKNIVIVFSSFRVTPSYFIPFRFPPYPSPTLSLSLKTVGVQPPRECIINVYLIYPRPIEIFRPDVDRGPSVIGAYKEIWGRTLYKSPTRCTWSYVLFLLADGFWIIHRYHFIDVNIWL